MARATRFVDVAQTAVADSVAVPSDLTFTVPSGHVWRIGSIAATLVTSAEAGDRQLEVLLTDSADNIVGKYIAGAVQAASLTRVYVFSPGHPQETGFANGLMLRALASELQLPGGFKCRVYDSAAIDTEDDVLTVRILNEDMVE